LTSQKLAEGYFACIERFEPKLNAFRLKLRESALKTAVERDSELRQGKDRVPLHGIPLLTNDMFDGRNRNDLRFESLHFEAIQGRRDGRSKVA
jgi:Asp-tRNA(Asn)/Glu-tRNA(Gln) amidotransferase A subunit family amidase